MLAHQYFLVIKVGMATLLETSSHSKQGPSALWEFVVLGGVLISPHLYGFYFTLRKVEIHVLQCVCCRIADSTINLQNWLFFEFVSLAQSSAI